MVNTPKIDIDGDSRERTISLTCLMRKDNKRVVIKQQENDSDGKTTS